MKNNILKSKKKKVFVGMSGGVDSSVAAYLMKKKGYDVTGVFIKVWQPDFYECTWREDRLDAMRICAKLGIPFKTLDLEKEYKQEVVDYMIHEYKTGRTPNPDVMCNRYIKFGGFYDWAISSGADYVATGHYSRVKIDKTGQAHLLMAEDDNKDQTYFLWTLAQTKLRKCLFPIGDIKKPEVRKLAKKYNLITATKKDSQGLCFIGKVDMQDFLKNFIPAKIGKILNEKGEAIGSHDGAQYFTIGQRHGFTLTNNTASSNPVYVISKDLETNTVVVSDKKPGQKAMGDAKTLIIDNVNEINPWQDGSEYLARVRYRQPLQICVLKKINKQGSWKVVFSNSQPAVAIGQSVVIYKDGECFGGGIIEEKE
jgi:tRNA-specific 2-thiouridylase